MRRFANFIFGLLALLFVAFPGYSYLTEFIAKDPLTIETVDGRPFITVTQPQTITYAGPLDNSGYDISHPQCKSALPGKVVGFAIIGLNKGKPFSENPCFEKQWAWATSYDAAAIYINTADPGKGDPAAYGQRIARDTLDRLAKYNVSTQIPIWLDVETLNTWTSPDRAVSVLTEAMHLLAEAGYHVGIYSTTAHWFEITLNAKLGVPTWRAIGKFSDVPTGVAAAKAACTQAGIAGTIPAIVQFVATVDGVTLDRNILCTDPNGLVGAQ
jgi:hypothetical protein